MRPKLHQVERVRKVKNSPCQICGNMTNKGYHFGVECCRACAAFYRRSLESETVYKCLTGSNKCDIKNKDSDGKICKYCRFKKCNELGMKTNNPKKLHSPAPEDPTTSQGTIAGPMSQDSTPSTSNETKITPPILPTPSSSIPPEISQSILIFASKVAKNSIYKQEPYNEILAPRLPTQSALTSNFDDFIPASEKSFMKTIYREFPSFCEKFRPQKPIIMADSIDAAASIRYKTRYKVELAQLLMHCEEFAKLDYNTKILLHDHTLNIFFHSFLMFLSIKYECNKDIRYNLLMYDNSFWNLEYAPGVIRLKSKEKLFEGDANVKHWIPVAAKQIKLMYEPLIQLNLEDFEMCYLLSLILWSTETVKGIDPEIHDYAYKMIDQISNDLHEYYMEKKLFNYSSRLIRIMKFIDGAKIVLNDLKSNVLISQVSNTLDFNVDLSKLVDSFN